MCYVCTLDMFNHWHVGSIHNVTLTHYYKMCFTDSASVAPTDLTTPTTITPALTGKYFWLSNIWQHQTQHIWQVFVNDFNFILESST